MIRDIALAGIGLNLFGVLLLFRYGMPFRVETGGADYIMAEQEDEQAILAERRYRMIGNIGLLFVVAGSALQAMAVLLA
ncbi:MAG TPA: hypothetical protein VN713_00410 [Sphingomicrobium sp.]|nr:hypothetical protein [Sphingomicrobium sp.]